MEISIPEELGLILKSSPYELVVVGDLVSDVETIRNPSRLVWWGIGGALVTLLIMAKGILILIGTGVGAVPALAVSGGVGSVVIAALGVKGTIAAVKIGYAGGGIEVLNRLRSYREVESKEGKLILRK